MIIKFRTTHAISYALLCVSYSYNIAYSKGIFRHHRLGLQQQRQHLNSMNIINTKTITIAPLIPILPIPAPYSYF